MFHARRNEMEKKFKNPVLAWGWEHLVPKTWVNAVPIIFLILSVATSAYYFKAVEEATFQNEIRLENPLKHSARIVPARLDLGDNFFSGKKAVSMEISQKDFDEKRFPLVFAATSQVHLELYFWGIDSQGVFYFFKYPVDQKAAVPLKIAGVTFSDDFREIEVKYEKDGNVIFHNWLKLFVLVLWVFMFFFLLFFSIELRKSGKEADRRIQKIKEDSEMMMDKIERSKKECMVSEIRE